MGRPIGGGLAVLCGLSMFRMQGTMWLGLRENSPTLFLGGVKDGLVQGTDGLFWVGAGNGAGGLVAWKFRGSTRTH